MSKLPAEGTLMRAIYDALEAGPADCHTINQRLPKKHRLILANEVNRTAYRLLKKGLIKGRKPKGCVKMYALLDQDFPGLEGFATSRDFDLSKDELQAVLDGAPTRRAAAEKIGCSSATLYAMMRRMGIPTNQAMGTQSHRLDISRDELKELYEKHQTLRRVAQVLGVSCTAVVYHMKRFDLETKAPGGRGSVGRLVVQKWWNMLIDGEVEAVIESMGDRLAAMSEKYDKPEAP